MPSKKPSRVEDHVDTYRLRSEDLQQYLKDLFGKDVSVKVSLGRTSLTALAPLAVQAAGLSEPSMADFIRQHFVLHVQNSTEAVTCEYAVGSSSDSSLRQPAGDPG